MKERYGGEEKEVEEDVTATNAAVAELEDGKRVGETALRKARKHDFYLGLECTWLYK